MGSPLSAEEHRQRRRRPERQAGDVRRRRPSGSRRRFGRRSKQRVRARRVSPCAPGACRGRCGARTRTPCAGCGSRKMSNTSGSLPARLVVVGRADVDDDDGAARDRRRRSTSVSRVAVRTIVGERRLPAQALLDRLLHQRAVGAQRVELVGVRQQAEQQVARRAVGRLGAGGEQQPEEGEDLLVGEALAVELGLREHADQVVARVARAARRARRRSSRAAAADALECRAPMSTVTLISSTAQRWNCGRSSRGQPEHRGDD